MGQLLNFILHIDKYLEVIIQDYGTLTYLFFFIVVFCETGLVVIPFLPGDSLIFTASAYAAKGSLNIWLIFAIFACAAILGDTVNYQIGHFIGPKVFNNKDSKIFKKEYLDKTQTFYDRHGAVTIIIARFMPIIRTFAPFVAGVGKMHYLKFLAYNVVGGLLWVTLFTVSGFCIGNIPFIRDHFTTVIYGIIIVSLLPAFIGFVRGKLNKEKAV
jgi:membrane-associated protein